MTLKTFTIGDIRSWKPKPCYNPNRCLPEDWKGTALDILRMKEIPIDDRFWVVLREELLSAKELRLFAVRCVRRVQHLMRDERSIKALDVAERFANGNATKEELAAARKAARAAKEVAGAAWPEAREAAWTVTWAGEREARAAWNVVWETARVAWAAWEATGEEVGQSHLQDLIGVFERMKKESNDNS